MNHNPKAFRILCYGDSNTWGRSGNSTQRYPANIRWTGILQASLGDDYEIIEAGLRGRTTNLDDANLKGKNGQKYLSVFLETHQPLNLIILWLGTNDLQEQYQRTPREISLAVKGLIHQIKSQSVNSDNTPTDVLLVSPPLVREDYLKSETKFKGAGVKSKELGKLYQKVADETNSLFIDLATLIKAGEKDGVHLEPEAHQVVAKVFEKVVKQIKKGQK